MRDAPRAAIMGAALVPIAAFAVLAGACAFLIECDESLHRFPRSRAVRRGLTSGLTAAAVFAALGVVIMAVLTR